MVEPVIALQPFTFLNLLFFSRSMLLNVSYACTRSHRASLPVRQKYIIFSTMLLTITASGFIFFLHDLSQVLPAVLSKSKSWLMLITSLFYKVFKWKVMLPLILLMYIRAISSWGGKGSKLGSPSGKTLPSIYSSYLPKFFVSHPPLPHFSFFFLNIWLVTRKLTKVIFWCYPSINLKLQPKQQSSKTIKSHLSEHEKVTLVKVSTCSIFCGMLAFCCSYSSPTINRWQFSFKTQVF